MKKSKLGRLPVLAASRDDAERVRIQPDMKWLMKAETQEVDGEAFLIVNFYDRDELKKDISEPYYRTFFTYDGHITQVVGENREGWKTGRRAYIMYAGFKQSTKAAGAEDCRIICDFFEKWKGKPCSSDPVRLIDEFQEIILRKKLGEKHKKITDRIDREMQGIAAMPPEFEAWTDESVMVDSRYFFYKYEKRVTEEGICSCCGKKSRIRSRDIHYRKQVVCPDCGKTLTALSVGRMPAKIHDHENVAAVQKVNEKLVVRYFHVHKIYDRDKAGKCVPRICEYARKIHGDGGWKSYEWDFFKSSGKIRWCDSRNRMDTESTVLWPVGIHGALKDTVFEYTALEEYVRQKKGCAFDVWRYLFRAEKHSWIEKLVKCGFMKLADDGVGYWSRIHSEELVDETKSKLHQILRLSHGYFAVLPRDIDPYGLRFYQGCFKVGISAGSDLFALCDKYMIHQKEIFDYAEYAPLWKIAGYLAERIRLSGVSELSRNAVDNLVRSWCDYLNWCKALGYDLHDEYYLLPGDLKKAHDRVGKEYREYLDQKRKKKMKIIRARATKYLKQAGMQIGIIEKGGYQIIVPKNSQEIADEGKRLHHCVQSYIPQVADRSTLILFLRKKDMPEKSFRTLEWKNNEFKQCQGKSNQEKNGKEILDFLDFAQKKLIERLGEKKAA